MPVAPTGLSATSTGATEITITWTNSEEYSSIELQRQTISQSWNPLKFFDTSKVGYVETYSITATVSVIYEFRVRGYSGGWSDWSNTDTAVCWGDVGSSGIKLSGTSTEMVLSGDYSDTVSATIKFEGFSLDSGSISTAYAYYLADSAGKIYEYSDDYKGDAGNTIPCEWQGKETNFVDQFKELESRYKVIHFARLYYVDKSSGVSTTIKLSTDGGVTWKKSVTKTIGTGDGKNKSADFFFPDGPVSAQFITPKIESNTSDKDLQWTALALYFDPGAEDFSI